MNCTKFPKIQPDKTKWEVVFIPSEPRYRVLEMPPPAPVHRGIFRAFRHFRGAGVYNLSSATESRFRRDPEGVWDLHTFRLYLALAHVLVSPLSEVSILRPKVNTILGRSVCHIRYHHYYKNLYGGGQKALTETFSATALE